jgi:hypothetical protein
MLLDHRCISMTLNFKVSKYYVLGSIHMKFDTFCIKKTDSITENVASLVKKCTELHHSDWIHLVEKYVWLKQNSRKQYSIVEEPMLEKYVLYVNMSKFKTVLNQFLLSSGKKRYESSCHSLSSYYQIKTSCSWKS